MEPFPVRAAETLLKERGVDSLPVQPIQIATEAGITCQAMPSEQGGVSGMLVKAKDAFGILYATHIPVPGFQHFSISHELGHYFLPKHPENVLKDSIHRSNSGFVSDDKYEKEADQFACGLLMPSYLFDHELDEAGLGMDAVLKLADICGTSRTATAIRYAQRNSEPTAIVVSSNGRVDYCFMSDELKEYPGMNWLRKGVSVPPGTKTESFVPARILNCERDEGDSDLVSWFRSDMDGSIYEEVIGLGKYGKALTVLSCSDLPDLEELEEDEDLKESWTPRFKR